tara:strand:- start:242 stop:412 length:171 start_codon:yes stop_codon:yes gene_type:complete
MNNNITFNDISKKMGVSVDKLRRLRKAGKIPAGWQAHPHAPVLYNSAELKKIQAVL